MKCKNPVCESDPEYEGYCAMCDISGVPALIAENERLKRELENLRLRMHKCHLIACTEENCLLDGGPEHDEAFDLAKEPTNAE